MAERPDAPRVVALADAPLPAAEPVGAAEPQPGVAAAPDARPEVVLAVAAFAVVAEQPVFAFAAVVRAGAASAAAVTAAVASVAAARLADVAAPELLPAEAVPVAAVQPQAAAMPVVETVAPRAVSPAPVQQALAPLQVAAMRVAVMRVAVMEVRTAALPAARRDRTAGYDRPAVRPMAAAPVAVTDLLRAATRSGLRAADFPHRVAAPVAHHRERQQVRHLARHAGASHRAVRVHGRAPAAAAPFAPARQSRRAAPSPAADWAHREEARAARQVRRVHRAADRRAIGSARH